MLCARKIENTNESEIIYNLSCLYSSRRYILKQITSRSYVRAFPVAQWLRLSSLTECAVLIPGQGTKIPHALRPAATQFSDGFDVGRWRREDSKVILLFLACIHGWMVVVLLMDTGSIKWVDWEKKGESFNLGHFESEISM